MDLQRSLIGEQDAQKLSFFLKNFLTSSRFSPDTRLTYSQHLNDFFRHVPDRVSALTVEHVEAEFLRYSRRVSASTANVHISIIRSFFRFMSRQGWPNLADHICEVPALRGEQRVLSRDEYKIILDKSAGYMRDCFIVLCNTGLRASEFLTLRPENVGAEFIRVVGKGRKNRSIPVCASVAEVVRRDPGLEFIRGSTRSWLHWVCRRLSACSGVAEFHPHSCRHYCATELYRAGVPVATIARILGHASSAVTEAVYIHWKDADLRGVMNCLDR